MTDPPSPKEQAAAWRKFRTDGLLSSPEPEPEPEPEPPVPEPPPEREVNSRRSATAADGTRVAEEVALLKSAGNAAFRNADYAEAERLYTLASRHDPSDHLLHSNLACVHLKTGEWLAALTAAKLCLKIDPTCAKGIYRAAKARKPYFLVS